MQVIYLLLTINAFVTSYERRCPSSSEWIHRTRIVCPKRSPFNYFCLYNTLEDNVKEGCDGPDFDRPGHKRVYSGGFDRGLCSEDRYQPIKFWTNGSSDCGYRKSICSEEGQIAVNGQSSRTDTACRCDYTKGYTFPFKPLNNCTCIPSEEDCSCVKTQCSNNYSLSPDYICVENTQSSLAVNSICPVLQVSIDDTDRNETFITNNKGRPSFSFTIFKVSLLIFVFILLIIMLVTLHGCKNYRCCVEEETVKEQETKQTVMDLETVMETIKSQANKDGVSIERAIEQYIGENKNKEFQWENEPVMLAVTGQSGVGKSSFINAIRNVKPNDPTFAKASSSGNTTKLETGYSFPGNNMITIYDLPGFGTNNCTIDNYEKRMELNKYDYIFVFVGNITENDIRIGKKLKEMDKKFCFVRSKLDVDFQSAEKDGQTKEKVFEEVRGRALAILKEQSLSDIEWFAISSRNKKIGQYDNLLKYFKAGLPHIKREAFIFSLAGELTNESIEAKYQLLKEQIPVVCLLAACAAAVPVPGLDLALNIMVVVEEINKYIKTFGFEDEFLKKAINDPRIKTKLHKNSMFFSKGNVEALKYCIRVEISLAKLMALQSDVGVCMGVIGSLISGFSAIIPVKITLDRVLSRCRDDAKVLSSYYAKEISN